MRDRQNEPPIKFNGRLVDEIPELKPRWLADAQVLNWGRIDLRHRCCGCLKTTGSTDDHNLCSDNLSENGWIPKPVNRGDGHETIVGTRDSSRRNGGSGYSGRIGP